MNPGGFIKMCMHGSPPTHMWQAMEAIDLKMLKVSRCSCASIYCPSWTLSSLQFYSCAIAHLQQAADLHIHHIPTGIWDGEILLIYLISFWQLIPSPPSKLLTIPIKAKKMGLREQEKEVGGPRPCPDSSFCSQSQTASSIDSKELGTGEAELELTDVIKNLPSKDIMWEVARSELHLLVSEVTSQANYSLRIIWDIANGQLLPHNTLVPFSLTLFRCIFIDCSNPLNLISFQVSFLKARTLLYEVHKRLYLCIIYYLLSTYLPTYPPICFRKEGRMEGKKKGIDFCESSILSIT